MNVSLKFLVSFKKHLKKLLVTICWNVIEFFQSCILMYILTWFLLKLNLWKTMINSHNTLMITFLLRHLASGYHWLCFILQLIKSMNFLMLVYIVHNIILFIFNILQFCENCHHFSFRALMIAKTKVEKKHKKAAMLLFSKVSYFFTMVSLWIVKVHWALDLEEIVLFM